jgi:hypothetical protein
MRTILDTNVRHPEKRPQGASRRTRDRRKSTVRTAATTFLTLAALLLGACSPEPAHYPAVRRPLGVREVLHPGHWRGPVGLTEVAFAIDQVSTTTVSVHVSGTVLHQANRSLETSSVQNYFYDRPRTCKITADARSFDCTRYTDMHIDNGLLCGTYEAPEQSYQPCLEPVP